MVVSLLLLLVRRRRAAHQGGAHGGPVVLGQRHNGKSFVTDTSVMTHPRTRSETKGHPGLELAQSLNRAAD